MNVPEAGFCSGCGAQLGLEPVGQAGALPCPICKTPLDVYCDGAGADVSGSLHDCSRCGGQFVDHHLLRELLRRHEHVAFADLGPRPTGMLDPRNGYIPCPECHALMNRKNFGGSSGVIVDVCKKHGTWFDLGELPRVLAFVASGGLERSRLRAAEEEQREKREAHARAASVAPVSAHDPSSSYGAGASFAEMLVDLLLG
jgi:Zn-finger nucleic acid-binding protein